MVESIPGKVSGAWVFKGTRTPAAIVFENLEDGMTIDEVVEQFPVRTVRIRRQVIVSHSAEANEESRRDTITCRRILETARRRAINPLHAIRLTLDGSPLPDTG